VANASHELRTPLTADRTVLQVALAGPDATAAALRSACEGTALTAAARTEGGLDVTVRFPTTAVTYLL
jgi:signal transduction histidine kinase